MRGLTKSDYAEASADRTARIIGPDLVMRRFHLSMPGMDDLWHVYCADHAEFGYCGNESEAAQAALEHGNREHKSAALIQADT